MTQVIVGLIYGLIVGIVAAFLVRAVNARAGTRSGQNLRLLAIAVVSVLATSGIGVLRMLDNGSADMLGSIAYGIGGMTGLFGFGVMINAFDQ